MPEAKVIRRIVPPPLADEVVGVVLAGGQGCRMDGHDKGLISYQGQAMLDHVLQRLRPQVGRVVINANRHLDAYRLRGLPVVSDQVPDYPGPLAGMVAVMESSSSSWYLFVPCDVPTLPVNLFRHLRQVQSSSRQPVICARDATGLQPTFALVSRSLYEPLRHALRIGERRLQTVFGALGLATAEWTGVDVFRNLNLPDDLRSQGNEVIGHQV